MYVGYWKWVTPNPRELTGGDKLFSIWHETGDDVTTGLSLSGGQFLNVLPKKHMSENSCVTYTTIVFKLSISLLSTHWGLQIKWILDVLCIYLSCYLVVGSEVFCQRVPLVRVDHNSIIAETIKIRRILSHATLFIKIIMITFYDHYLFQPVVGDVSYESRFLREREEAALHARDLARDRHRKSLF